MAALILPSRWTQQPQGAVELSQEWADGALGVIVPPSAPFSAFASHKLAAYPSGVGVTATASSAGAKVSSSRILAGLDKSTLLVIYDRTGLTSLAAGRVFYCERSESVQIFKLTYGATPGRVSFVFRNSASQIINNATNVIADTSRQVNVAALVTNGAASRTVFADGVSAENTTNYPNSFTAANDVRIGGDAQDAAGFFNGGVLAVAQWGRALSLEELTVISEAPWQIFRPLVRRIYFDLGAGGGVTDAALSAAGSAAVALASQAIAKAALSSAGAASTSAVGQALAQASLSAQGSATVAATGQALHSATVTAAGVASVSLAGQSVSVSALASSGIATNSWAAKALASSTVAAAGIAAAAFVPLGGGVVSAAMSSAGVGAFSVVAQSITQAAMSAAGSGLASWVSLVTGYADASFVMAGAAASSLAAQAIAQAAASSAATSAAAFGGQTLKQGAFSAAGSATSAWAGQSIAGAVLGAVGAGAAAFVGKAICQASAYAAGTGSVNWMHGNGPVVPALLRITAIRLMTVVGARPELAPHVSARHRLN